MLELSYQKDRNHESELDTDKSNWRKVLVKNITNPGTSEELNADLEVQRNLVSRGTASTIMITPPKKRKYNNPEHDNTPVTDQLSPFNFEPLLQIGLENTPRSRKVQLLNEDERNSIFVSPTTGDTLQVLKMPNRYLLPQIKTMMSYQ